MLDVPRQPVMRPERPIVVQPDGPLPRGLLDGILEWRVEGENREKVLFEVCCDWWGFRVWVIERENK